MVLILETAALSIEEGHLLRRLFRIGLSFHQIKVWWCFPQGFPSLKFPPFQGYRLKSCFLLADYLSSRCFSLFQFCHRLKPKLLCRLFGSFRLFLELGLANCLRARRIQLAQIEIQINRIGAKALVACLGMILLKNLFFFFNLGKFIEL